MLLFVSDNLLYWFHVRRLNYEVPVVSATKYYLPCIGVILFLVAHGETKRRLFMKPSGTRRTGSRASVCAETLIAIYERHVLQPAPPQRCTESYPGLRKGRRRKRKREGEGALRKPVLKDRVVLLKDYTALFAKTYVHC